MSYTTRSYSVSVVIPAFNAASCIRRALDSVLGQCVPETEIIVVDDGSKDNTQSQVTRYGSRIRLIVQENRGQAAARNAGISASSGDFVAFLDADDYWLPGFLRICLKELVHHSDLVAVSTAALAKKWGRPDAIVPQCQPDLAANGTHCRPLPNFFDFWASFDHVRTGSVLIRGDVLRTAGPQLEDLWVCEDLEYWGYLATFGPWGFIPEPLFVMDGMETAAAEGWSKKNNARRKRCPTVEQWERRILPRLRPEDVRGFSLARGRVARHFAHSKILIGERAEAYEIALKYGSDFDSSWAGSAMRVAAKAGRLPWMACCAIISGREATKSLSIQARYLIRRRRATS